MSFNLNDCKLCGETNSLVKDDNTNNIICRICGAITKENEIEEINDFQKLLIPQNDKYKTKFKKRVKFTRNENKSKNRRIL